MRARPHPRGEDRRRLPALVRLGSRRDGGVGRSVLTGAVGCLLTAAGVVVPMVVQGGSDGGWTAVHAAANTRTLAYDIPKPGGPIVLPKPVTMTVTPQRAMGNPGATVRYSVRWKPPRPPRALPGEKPAWVVNLRFFPTQPEQGTVIFNQWRLPPWKRMWTGQQDLKPGTYTVVATVEDAAGEIGFAAVEDVEVIPPPAPSTTTTTRPPTTPTTTPTTSTTRPPPTSTSRPPTTSTT